MVRFGFLTVAGSVISFASLLGFVLLASANGSQLRYLLMLFYVLATVGFFLFAARLISVYSLVILGSLVALLSVCIQQVLGFCCFPGLVKDLAPFGLDHLRTVIQVFFITMSWYVVVVCVAAAVMRKKALASPGTNNNDVA